MNVKFYKNCGNTGKILKNLCVRYNFVKFDIRFLKKKCARTNWFMRVGKTRHIRCLQLIIEWYVKMIAERRQRFFFIDQ